MKLDDLTFDIEQRIDIKAGPEKVVPAMLKRFGEDNTKPGVEPMPMMLEVKPGGRWYRDRGNGIGHLWGFVQVIKPPTLLELSGPMFMSYPANNHLEVKVEEIPGGSRVTLRHRAIGMIDPEHRKGAGEGWKPLPPEITPACE